MNRPYWVVRKVHKRDRTRGGIITPVYAIYVGGLVNPEYLKLSLQNKGDHFSIWYLLYFPNWKLPCFCWLHCTFCANWRLGYWGYIGIPLFAHRVSRDVYSYTNIMLLLHIPGGLIRAWTEKSLTNGANICLVYSVLSSAWPADFNHSGQVKSNQVYWAVKSYRCWLHYTLCADWRLGYCGYIVIYLLAHRVGRNVNFYANKMILLHNLGGWIRAWMEKSLTKEVTGFLGYGVLSSARPSMD